MWKKPLMKYNTPFKLKDLRKSRIQDKYLNIIKAIYSKPIAHIKLNVEKLEAV